MSNDYIEEQRLGAREPRSKLLPPYLLSNPYFKDFADAIDRVWADKVDSKIEVIQYLRDMWVTNPTVEQKILDGQLIDLEDWTRPERSLLVRQVNLLGMKLKSAGLLTDQNYLVVSRFIGQYWFGKGTQAFIQFINFALILDLEVHNLWSQRESGVIGYNNLTRELPDGSPPGTPIWEGGDWFPTTHVEIIANGGLSTISIDTLAEFFYEIANYNLVLSSVDSDYVLPVTPDPETPVTRILAAAIVQDSVIVVATTGRYGAAAPESKELIGIPTRVYGTGAMLLGRPDAWFMDSQDRKFPVYRKGFTSSNADSLPTKLFGEQVGTGDELMGYALLRSPQTWTPLPGNPRTGGSLPSWSAAPPIVVNDVVPTQVIGERDVLLANPRGFASMNGAYVPYW